MNFIFKILLGLTILFLILGAALALITFVVYFPIISALIFPVLVYVIGEVTIDEFFS